MYHKMVFIEVVLIAVGVVLIVGTLIYVAKGGSSLQQSNSSLTQPLILTLPRGGLIGKMGDIKKRLVLHHADWCGHCRAMMPEYEKLGDNVGNVPVTKVVGSAGRSDVNGFPTIRLYQGDKFVEYRGRRTAEDIQQWVKSQNQSETI